MNLLIITQSKKTGQAAQALAVFHDTTPIFSPIIRTCLSYTASKNKSYPYE